MCRAKNFPVVFTRTANVYGPGQALYRIVPKTILSALLNRNLLLDGGGTSRRSFIHIDDASDATYRVAKSGEIGETYHISTNELISIKELVHKIFEKTNGDYAKNVVETQDRVGKDLGYFLDSSKIRKELNWQPKVSLDEGLRQTILWATENLQELSGKSLNYEHKA
jgi:dTDP-glucose 4,6-dehydratase